MQQHAPIVFLLAIVGPGCASSPDAADAPEEGPPAARGPAAELTAFRVTLPGTEVSIEMVPIPAGEVDGRAVGPFWMSSTEITWDAFDLFVYGAGRDGVDAISRPSIPYISMDRGFGHEGWPVLSLSPKGGSAFCDWLTALTGRTFRLPTDDEWLRAAGSAPADLDAVAWFADNAGGRTHPPAEKLPNAFGLYDMLGNAGEWCVGAEGPLLAGGTYRDAAADVTVTARVRPSHAWNASDPQIPRSTWWLADAGFTGLRVVCVVP